MKNRPTHLTAYRMKRRLRSVSWPVSILLGAVVIGTGIGFGLARFPYAMTPAYGESISGCSVTDGDTIRCDGERIRLLGIDAPELPGHCREGRDCVPGDPFASTTSLTTAMSSTMRISRVGVDRYGRTLAIVESDHGDLSCWQLTHHQAIYKPNWDNGMRVMRLCPSKAWGS
jgi:hypothetical protein